MAEEQKEVQQPSEVASSSAPDDKTLLMLTHASGIIAGWIVPLVMYLVKTDASNLFKSSVREALNFQITITIAYAVAMALCALFIGVFIIPVISLVNLILCIMAAMAIAEGKDYRYPFAIRLVK